MITQKHLIMNELVQGKTQKQIIDAGLGSRKTVGKFACLFRHIQLRDKIQMQIEMDGWKKRTATDVERILKQVEKW